MRASKHVLLFADPADALSYANGETRKNKNMRRESEWRREKTNQLSSSLLFNNEHLCVFLPFSFAAIVCRTCCCIVFMRLHSKIFFCCLKLSLLFLSRVFFLSCLGSLVWVLGAGEGLVVCVRTGCFSDDLFTLKSLPLLPSALTLMLLTQRLCYTRIHDHPFIDNCFVACFCLIHFISLLLSSNVLLCFF